MSTRAPAKNTPHGSTRASRGLRDPARAATPRHVPLSLIDEDPNQPRGADSPGFSPRSIAEIGATIKARGVKSPISVRENPDAPGRYVINHGARRYRGSKWAGKRTIPAFIDNDYNDVDQVIENLHRDALTAREIADFIGRALAKGKKKGEIAKELGKSAAFVSQHVTLLDLPDPIAEVFTLGRCRDVTVINELVKLNRRSPAEVRAWLADDSQDLTRGAVKLLREFLEDKRSQASQLGNAARLLSLEDRADAGTTDSSTAGARMERRKAHGRRPAPTVIQVRHGKRTARLRLDLLPRARGWCWLQYDDSGEQAEVDLKTVRLVAVLQAWVEGEGGDWEIRRGRGKG